MVVVRYRHGWHGTFVLYCSHCTSTCFCSPLSQRFIFVSLPAHTKIFRTFERNGYMEFWMLLWVRRIPHVERNGRFRLSPGEVKNPRFEAGVGTSIYAWMPLPSPWGLILITGVGVSRVLRETTTGLVSSGNCVFHTITIYEGYNRHAILHSSGRVFAEGLTKILRTDSYLFVGTRP